MTINTLQFNIASPLYKVALDGFKKISICADTLFSIIKEEGFAWKSFLSNNSYIYNIYSVGSKAVASIEKNFFTPASPYIPPMIDDSNASMEALHSSNKAWIQDHSRIRKSYPNLNFSDEILLDVIFSKGTDSKGVMQFAKNFCASTGQDNLTPALLDWEKAYERQQFIHNRPQEIRNVSSDLAERIQRLAEQQGRVLLLLEKEPTCSTSPLSGCVKKLLEKYKPVHDRLYQNYYREVKEKLQTYLDTNWKKRCFTEIQEEIRAILLEQYSELHQMGTLKHNLPNFLQPLLLTGGELPSSEDNKSLPEVVWDLFLQNSLTEAIDQSLSVEKLNQVFEKEFSMITSKLEMLTLGGINQLIENVGEETQLLLQLCSSKFPQKNRGWLEITPECERYCQVNLCVRDMAHPRINMTTSGEAIPIKKYSYNKVPTRLLQTSFFVDLLASVEGDESPIASREKIKKFFAELGNPVESHVQSGRSALLQTGMLHQIQTYYCDREGAPLESIEKLFFQMRLHAFVNYCGSVQKNPVISNATLSTLQNSIEFLQAEAGRLHETKWISDQEYMETIATTLEVEEYTIKHQKKIRAEREGSLGDVIPPLIKDQLQNLFATIPISELDIKNIKSFANVLLGKDMSDEVALLCKELPVANKKVHNYNPPHLSLLKLLKTLRIDLGNLRASPIGLFKLYSDVNRLLHQSQTLITCLSCIPYFSMVALYTNPVALLAVVITTATVLGALYTRPSGRAILNAYKAICDFHREAYTFLFMRVLMRLLQLSDIALHWSQTDPIQKARFFVTKNMSNKVSFSLHMPLEPVSPCSLQELSPENIPREVAPLERFYPHMSLIPDRHNLQEIRQIVFPKLSTGFRIEEHNGAMRARLHGQSEFWLAETITDTKLDNADLPHLLLENDQGDKKICIVARSPQRLFLQTLLRICNAYSRKSIDLLSDFRLDRLSGLQSIIFSDLLSGCFQEELSEAVPSVYYCDWIDGEIISQDCNAIGYLIAHYMASGDVVRSEKLVDQLKKMKATGKIENPKAMLKMVEEITSSSSRFLSPDMTKIILQLCALCDEIPLESKAFSFFLRVYQWYVDSKEEGHMCYLSEEEESLLLHHLKDESGEVVGMARQAALASSSVGYQTLSLLMNNVFDGVYNISPLGKAGYIPASLKKYELQQKYLHQGGDLVPLLLGLAMNNLINPNLFLGKGLVDALKNFYKGKGSLFDLLPIFFFKNARSNTPKNEQPILLILPILIAVLEANKDSRSAISSTMLKALLSILQDTVALSITINSGYCLEEKLSALMQSTIGLPLNTPSLNQYGIEKTYPVLPTRHLIRAGIRTVENFVETHNTYKKQEEIENSHWFPVETLPTEYVNLQNLEQSILKRYRDISETFLRKQERAFCSPLELNFQERSSVEDQWRHIVDWHESGRARDSNRATYFLHAIQSSEGLIQELQQVHAELTAMRERQRETIQDLLKCPQQELGLLNHQIDRYAEEIRDGFATAEEMQRLIREEYQNQSTIKKVGLGFLRYINTLLEVPSGGLLQFPENQKIDILRTDRSELLKEVESIQAQKEQVFQNMMTAFKSRTSLGVTAVYTYFCQGKDTSIIRSLDLNENQWKVIKEQLYRYMILQKYLSYAEYLKELYMSRDRTINETMDFIGHEIDQMIPTIEELPQRDISVRSVLQLEKKLGRTLSPDLRNRVNDRIGASLKNYQAVYQLALSA